MPLNDIDTIVDGYDQEITDWQLGDDRIFSGNVAEVIAGSSGVLTDAIFTLKLNPADLDINALLQLRVTTAPTTHGRITAPATISIHVFSPDYADLVAFGPVYYWDFRVICDDGTTITVATGTVQFKQHPTQTNAAGTPSVFPGVGVPPNNGQPRFRGFASGPPTVGIYNIGDLLFNSVPSVNGPMAWTCVAGGDPGVWLAWGTSAALGIALLYATAPPVAGTWARGDLILNSAITAGGGGWDMPGWMCTQAGTPGVWKALAPVEA